MEVEDTLTLGRGIVHAALPERYDEFGKQVAAIASEASRVGAFSSGRTMIMIYEAAGRELALRMDMAWRGLYRSLVNTGVQPHANLSTQLRNALSSLRSMLTEDLDRTLADYHGRIKLGLIRNVDEFWDRSFAKEAAEIDLFCASLQARTEGSVVSLVQPFVVG